jgi:ABC-2 type transport system ATP-binding protein
METVIATSGLTKRYRDVLAVDGLSLSIGRGEIYGFLGLNGAGKTTTIRMLLGMIQPNGGSVSLFGTAIRPGLTDIWRRVGYMVETPHAYPDLTVRENLEVSRRLHRLDSPGVVDEVIDMLSLGAYAGRKAKTLSLGNAQRLGLAKALIHHPDLLVLDEPANALDPAGIVEIRELLRCLAAENGVTIFVSSHILAEVARLASRIGVIHEGRLLKEVDTRDLAELEDRRLEVDVRDATAALAALQRAGIPAGAGGPNTLVLTEPAAIACPEDVATVLVRADNPPRRLVVERADLESYFLKLVGTEGEKS